jgi:hypothetical protein
MIIIHNIRMGAPTMRPCKPIHRVVDMLFLRRKMPGSLLRTLPAFFRQFF